MHSNYIARGQFNGWLRWLCTGCKKTNKSQVGQDKPYITCVKCGQSWQFKLQWWETVPGNHRPPSDIILPDNAEHIQPVVLRCQLIGMLKFSCPHCGHLFRRRMMGNVWRIECANTRPPTNCGRTVVIGVHLAKPEEPTVPLEAFVEVKQAGQWRSQRPIHSQDPVTE